MVQQACTDFFPSVGGGDNSKVKFWKDSEIRRTLDQNAMVLSSYKSSTVYFILICYNYFCYNYYSSIY